MWNPAVMPSLPAGHAAIADALVIVAAMLAVGMAVSNRLTKRLGLAAALLGLGAAIAVRTPLVALLEIAVLALWLIGRGIPGRRPRPVPVRLLAGVLAVLAIASVVRVVR